MSYATGYGIIVGSMWISAAISKDNWALLFFAALLTGLYTILFFVAKIWGFENE